MVFSYSMGTRFQVSQNDQNFCTSWSATVSSRTAVDLLQSSAYAGRLPAWWVHSILAGHNVQQCGWLLYKVLSITSSHPSQR